MKKRKKHPSGPFKPRIIPIPENWKVTRMNEKKNPNCNEKGGKKHE